MLGFPICWLRICFCALLATASRLSATSAGQSKEPEFAELVPNITVAVGREAVLPCVVDHLGSYIVAWIKVDTQTIYTIHTRVISHNSRIGASHNGHRIWNLHIRNVQEEDRGFYMCQINTAPMKNQVGYINIVVPPDIIYQQSSSDIVVNEGGNASLYCKATGYPPPKITWRREDDGQIIIRTNNRDKMKVYTMEGDVLNFTKVTRKHMGAYLCIASNKIPPSISKRIFLQVNIKPKVKVRTQVLAAPLGSDVTMECDIEASPKPVNYWTRENGEILISSTKYQVLEKADSYRITFSLRIKQVEERDFGSYNCTTKNLLGSSEGSIQLIEMLMATTKSEWFPKATTSQITDRTEESIPHNRTSASKVLNSFKYADRNEFEKITEKTEPSKGTTLVQSQSSKVMKTPDNRSRGHRTESNTNCGQRREWSALLPLLLWYIFLRFAVA